MIQTNPQHRAYRLWEETIKGLQSYGPAEVIGLVRRLATDASTHPEGTIHYFEQLEVQDVITLAADISKVRRLTGMYPPRYTSHAAMIAVRHSRIDPNLSKPAAPPDPRHQRKAKRSSYDDPSVSVSPVSL